MGFYFQGNAEEKMFCICFPLFILVSLLICDFLLFPSVFTREGEIKLYRSSENNKLIHYQPEKEPEHD